MRVQANDGKWYDVVDPNSQPAANQLDPTKNGWVMSSRTNEIITIIVSALFAVATGPQFVSWVGNKMGGNAQQIDAIQKQLDDANKKIKDLEKTPEKKVSVDLVPIDNPALPFVGHEMERVQDDLSNRALADRIAALEGRMKMMEQRPTAVPVQPGQAVWQQTWSATTLSSPGAVSACSSAQGMQRAGLFGGLLRRCR